ncbi:hypothetical protein [Streptomyces sp. NPDC048527]|uniref:hypothetical protein n=1 Tax=Streptomyces sp. NPDC048527 TaxID=3365568 RepID=UPI00371630A9
MHNLPPLHPRQLGRDVAALIPQSGSEVSAAGQAAAALAALQTVPVQLGVLQAAALLLDELGSSGADDETRATAEETARLLRAAMGFPTARTERSRPPLHSAPCPNPSMRNRSTAWTFAGTTVSAA